MTGKILKQCFFLIAFVATTSATAVTEVECEFVNWFNLRYFCEFRGLQLSDDPNQEIVITGQHLPNKTNADVDAVLIFFSDVPFIISQVFTTFPNMIFFGMFDSGLRRIQPNAFIHGKNIGIVHLDRNNISSIPSAAFIGMTNLDELDLVGNHIDNIHQNAFIGLPLLSRLTLIWNDLHELPDDVFRPLVRLRFLHISMNKIERLNARLFAHNEELRTLQIGNNQINAIQRGFFDRIPNVSILDFIPNRCISQNFHQTPWPIILEAAEPCFQNFDRIQAN